jgi:feruloyl-CoA synthase
VIAGESRDLVSALVWLNPAETDRLLGSTPEADGDVIHSATLAEHLADALAALNANAGSAARVERLLVMSAPANLDAGEITDKGYVNQRRVLARRAGLVEQLYAAPLPSHVITPATTAT